MKRTRKIIFAVLLIISLGAMFLPIATIEDNSIPAIEAKIKKLESRLQGAVKQLERWEKRKAAIKQAELEEVRKQ